MCLGSDICQMPHTDTTGCDRPKRHIFILYLEMLNNKEEYPDYPELEIWFPCLHKVHLFEVHRAVLFYSRKDVEWNGQFFLVIQEKNQF